MKSLGNPDVAPSKTTNFEAESDYKEQYNEGSLQEQARRYSVTQRPLSRNLISF